VRWIKLVKVDGKGEGKTRIVSIRARLLEEAASTPGRNSKDVGSQSRVPRSSSSA